MEYQIIEQPAFKVVGKAIRVSTKDGDNMRIIPQFWQKCVHNGTHDELETIAAGAGGLNGRMLGICMDFAGDMSEFTYMIAAEASGGAVPDGMAEQTIPAATWAVFQGRGPLPESIQKVWGGVWSEFFPTSGFQHGDGPDLEVYPKGDPSQPGYGFEVRVPVVKK